jgi:hypothetical protein
MGSDGVSDGIDKGNTGNLWQSVNYKTTLNNGLISWI